ncbi:hypothetical protein [Arthrobacter sp. AFG20]|uniref:hypothetical protein n=1 Tax=Arthrobacter sp. AFG20 TaxID=1688671 RepID=UPI000C9EBE68|nr:hypothetical protein [Arthrobacter sp. AFG20]PNH85651.1 hypothetical protein CXZ05_04970 [Arthrobacter sp. AFG20]
MPVTRNVAWDRRLESFKGRDTTQYVLTAASMARTCAARRGTLETGEPLSLLVNVTESTAPDGTSYVTFTDCVCHRRCSDPGLSVQHSQWAPNKLTPMAARMVLPRQSGDGQEHPVPVLAYTLVPVVAFRENDGDLTSALVSILLFHGFQLAMSPDFGDILEDAVETSASCSFAVTPQGLITLSIGDRTLFGEQLHQDEPNDALWLKAARGGHVLVISGDNLIITTNGLDIRHAAAQGTLVIGTVPVPVRPQAIDPLPR